MSTKDEVHGEGNYEASRQYNEATKKFVDSGRVDEAARAAAPKSGADAESMLRAEEIGRSRAKDDPAVKEPDPADPAIRDPQPDRREPVDIDDPSPHTAQPRLR